MAPQMIIDPESLIVRFQGPELSQERQIFPGILRGHQWLCGKDVNKSDLLGMLNNHECQ